MAAKTDASVKTKGDLSIHTENIFPVIKKWLYSEHEIFLRELISNSCDAITKRLALDENFKEENGKVTIVINEAEKSIKVVDNGIGMTAQEVEKYINQIAFSGAEEFIGKYKDKQNSIIGHFGLGFYSTFMVSEKVTIDTLSCSKDATPAFWECDGSISYTLAEGEKTEIGTAVTLYLNEDSLSYMKSEEITRLVEKYSNFMPYPIEFEEKIINAQTPLWQKKPADVTDEEYKEFYKKIFKEWEDPLFWIHLNVDYPFTLKGILYFPKVKSTLDINRGTVKLFCNNVFVADNLKEFIPEFLLLLKGSIDAPEIPLNVSRSFLQNDAQVKKISQYIIKKVADSLIDIFKTDRKRYAELFKDIEYFIKYGILTEEKFSEYVKDYLLFKTSNQDSVTLAEFLERNKSQAKPQKIYYAASEESQISFQRMLKEQGQEIIFTSSPMDTHIYQHLEIKNHDINFSRIDSELGDNLVDATQSEEEKTFSEKVKKALEDIFTDGELEIEAKPLKAENIPGMIVFNEQMRRFHDMNMLMSNSEFDLLKNHTFVLNTKHPLAQKIVDFSAKERKSDAENIAKYVHYLALLEQKKLNAKELSDFIDLSGKVLNLIQ